MAQWLRSIQGQITDFAADVLNEATEDVVDAESELQVARRKCVEAERALVLEQQKVVGLENRVKELQDQLSEASVDLESVDSKYSTMVKSRDGEIRRLQIELEQLRAPSHPFLNEPSDGISYQERLSEVQREVAHWKGLLKQHQQEQADAAGAHKEELERQTEDERNKKNIELAALITMYEENMQQLRDEYEERISLLQMASSSESNQSDLLDAVLLEKEELLEEKRRLEQLVRLREEPEVDLLEDAHQFSALEERLRLAEGDIARMNSMADEIDSKNEEIVTLRAQLDELTSAYNDLNGELEKARENSGRQNTSNLELQQRNDNLKALLRECEERYEMCKRENADMMKRLEKLTSDFTSLNHGMQETKRRAITSDSQLTSEMDRLRNALELSKVDREKLREDVDRFRAAVDTIDSELQDLRDSNRRLAEENIALSGTIDKYDESVKTLLSRNEEQMGTFRDDFEDLQRIHQEKDDRWERLNTELRDKCVALEEELLRLKWEGESRVELVETETGETGASWDGVPARTLMEQLREALSANSEKTDECERLRAEKEVVEKDLQMRQSVVDEMVAQSNVLQLQQQHAATTIKQLRQELTERENGFYDMERQLARSRERVRELNDTLNAGEASSSDNVYNMSRRQETLGEAEEALDRACESHIDGCVSSDQVEAMNRAVKEASAEVDVLTEQISQMEMIRLDLEEKVRLLEQKDAEICTLQVSLSERESEIGILRTDVANMVEGVAQGSGLQTLDDSAVVALREELCALEATNARLRELATAKHEESTSYYQRLEATLQENALVQSELRSTQEQLAGTQRELASAREVAEKRERELGRLKEHLLIVEETSTREAIDAEKRETELRSLVRSLDEKSRYADHSVEERSQHYQSELRILQSRLTTAEAEILDWSGKCDQESRDKAETQSALSSLQGVVRELAADSERDAATATHARLQFQQKIQEQSAELVELRAEYERRVLDKQAAEEQTESIRELLIGKQRIVEELEVQLEEARATRVNEGYRVDDATLRQLFLSYFLAPVDKRSDIALLLASILEFAPEDMDKIKQCVRPNGSSPGVRSQGPTLSEQFIRFLEVESESSRTAPHLPVPHQSSSMQADPLANLPSGSSSSSALHHLLK